MLRKRAIQEGKIDKEIFMGYRLSISKVNEVFYGTKLFGYVNDKTKLKSYQFLKEYEYLDGDEIWDYNCPNAIAMRKADFIKFRELYAQDLKDYYHFDEDISGEEMSKDFLKQTEDLTKLKEFEYVVIKWE